MSRFRSRSWRRALGATLLAIPVAGSLVAAQGGQRTESPATARPDHATRCQSTSATPTVEERRLITPRTDGSPSVGAQILSASGFDSLVGDFQAALCGATSLSLAHAAVTEHGTDLWSLAVNRAQGRMPVQGALPGNDDRPLYWARLAMTLALRQWKPGFPLRDGDRASLETALERASRGMTSDAFHDHGNTRRIFVSGFDPFFLDTDPRIGNPSGAGALTLDGRTWTNGQGQRIEVQTVVFPVRYADFDQGIAEDVFRPVFTPRRSTSADMYATVSQGRPGAFDLELYNGRRRSSTAPDNSNLFGGGTSSAPLVFPNVGAGPEFVPSTLPAAQMYLHASGPFAVRINPLVAEIPASGATSVSQQGGPTPGSTAVEGSGGGYLSNEVAYRASLLRDVVGTNVPGGHIHTPVLDFDPANTSAITDPTFEHNRTAITDQLRTLIDSIPLR